MANETFHASAIRAVNEALVVLGQDELIGEGDLRTDSSVPSARKAAFIYEQARQRVLRDHAWNFAKREIFTAGGVCTCKCSGDDFEYRYPLPKMARLIMAYGESGKPVEYVIFAREIRARAPVARIVYIADIEDVDRWSDDAHRALVLRLAADLAKPVTGRINERQLQEQAYAQAIQDAKRNDARESNLPYDAWGENYYSGRMGLGDGCTAREV